MLNWNKLTPLITTIILFVFSFTAYGQDTVRLNTIPKIELFGFGGGLVAHHKEMRDLSKKPYQGNAVRMAFQTTGNAYWQQQYNLPVYGFGFYSGHYFNPAIGNPFAVFGFMEFPFHRRPDSYWSTSWSGGMTFHINEFDAVYNPANIAIGSDLNVYIDFSLLYKKQLSKRLDFGGGLKLQHFSNGATRFPNLGLNMVSGTLVLSYHLKDPGLSFAMVSPPRPATNKYEITVMTASGIRAKSKTENDIKYLNTVLSLGLNERVNFKRTVGFGVDVFYNQYLINEYTDRDAVTASDLMSYAVFLSSDMIADRFRMVTQLGFYTWRKTAYSLFFYERVALRYYLNDHLFTNVSIKAHAAKAQSIEWGLGITL